MMAVDDHADIAESGTLSLLLLLWPVAPLPPHPPTKTKTKNHSKKKINP